jgi:hypothetical protein
VLLDWGSSWFFRALKNEELALAGSQAIGIIEKEVHIEQDVNQKSHSKYISISNIEALLESQSS